MAEAKKIKLTEEEKELLRQQGPHEEDWNPKREAELEMQAFDKHRRKHMLRQQAKPR